MPIRTLYFIGQCLSLDEHPTFRETIIAQFSDPGYDWNSFIWTCSNHLVLPVIYLKFLKHDLLSYVPDVLAQHLEEIYTLNRIRNEQILLQVKEINATLKAAGISPIYLKGTGNLIEGIYSDIGERIIGDIDFLVPEKDYLAAAEIFKKEGYEICFPNAENSDLKRHHHYPRLWKKDVAADLEIHWSPVIEKYSFRFGADLVLRDKKTVVGYPECYVLSDEHKLILSFIHSQLTNHGHALGIESLRDVYDTYCFSKRFSFKRISRNSTYRQKHIAWLKMNEKLLNLPNLFYIGETLYAQLYRLKHDLINYSVIISNLNRLRWVLSVGIGLGVDRIAESRSDRLLRRSNNRNLFTPGWYIQNLKVGFAKYQGKKLESTDLSP